MVGLHPSDFRDRFGREMILDFEDGSGSHHVANFYLDALQSLCVSGRRISLLRHWSLYPRRLPCYRANMFQCRSRAPVFSNLFGHPAWQHSSSSRSGLQPRHVYASSEWPTSAPSQSLLQALVISSGPPPAAPVVRSLASRKQGYLPGLKAANQLCRRPATRSLPRSVIHRIALPLSHTSWLIPKAQSSPDRPCDWDHARHCRSRACTDEADGSQL